MGAKPQIDKTLVANLAPSLWHERPSFRITLAVLLAFGFWFAHLQWWWEANDDAVHQYFNALKLTEPEITRNLNERALAAMIEGQMEAKLIDRLVLRTDVTYNWLLTSTSIKVADRISEYLKGGAPNVEDFPAHLVASETIGFLAAFFTVTVLLIFAMYRYFDQTFFEAMLYAFAVLAVLALLRRALFSEFMVLLVVEACALAALYRVVRGSRFIVLLALFAFITAYGTLDHVIRSELFGYNLDNIVEPKGGIFQFVLYTLDTFIYPKRCCSPFGYFARSNFNLLMILLFALRWSNRYATSYALIAVLGLIHVAQSGLVLILLIVVDLLLRPEVFLRRRVALGLAVAALTFIARQGAWPSYAWLSDHAAAVGGVAVVALIGVLAVTTLVRRIEGTPDPFLGPILRMRAGLFATGPVLGDLVVVVAIWLGLSLSLLVLVKVLGQDRLQAMSYLSQVTLLGIPRRLLSMLQAPFIFGLILHFLISRRPLAAFSSRDLSKWALRFACFVALALWAGNLAQVVADRFPEKQVARMLARHEMALSRPPYPRRDFSEANMYYLMALYVRTGYYVPNGFFCPAKREPID